MCVRSVCVRTDSHSLVRDQHIKEITVKVEEQLTQLKRDTGLTFVKIAEIVGCARETIHKIKRDGTGDRSNLEAIDRLYKQHFSSSLVNEPGQGYETALEKVLGEDLASFARDAAGSLPGGAEEFVRDLVKAKRAESERLTDRSEEPPPRKYPIPNRKPARKTHES